ncbi:MAG: hypothetical protein K2P99_04600, partial [Burkholderiales bacterium]|nr:hypothetical protein [Burkholderiales bacterium]
YTGNNSIYPLCRSNQSTGNCDSTINQALIFQNGSWNIINWNLAGNNPSSCTTTYNNDVACANGINVVINDPATGNIINSYTFTGDTNINSNIGYFTSSYYYTHTTNDIWQCELVNGDCTSLYHSASAIGGGGLFSFYGTNKAIYAYFINWASSSSIGSYNFATITINNINIATAPYTSVGVSGGLAVDSNGSNTFYTGGLFSLNKCQVQVGSFTCKTLINIPTSIGLEINSLNIVNNILYIPAINTQKQIAEILKISLN